MTKPKLSDGEGRLVCGCPRGGKGDYGYRRHRFIPGACWVRSKPERRARVAEGSERP